MFRNRRITVGLLRIRLFARSVCDRTRIRVVAIEEKKSIVSAGGGSRLNPLLVAGPHIYVRDVSKEDQPKEIETTQDPECCLVWLQQECKKPWR